MSTPIRLPFVYLNGARGHVDVPSHAVYDDVPIAVDYHGNKRTGTGRSNNKVFNTDEVQVLLCQRWFDGV